MSLPIPYPDSHAHLTLVAQRLGEDALPQLFDRYGASPDTFLLDIGTVAGDWEHRRAVWSSCPAVMGTAGIWPGREALEDRVRAIRILIEDVRAGLSEARLRGIGECGLDYFHNEGSHEAQKALFEAQIECAIEFKLPLVVHSRDAFSDTLALVKRSASSIPVIIHCFGYGPREAEEFLAAGCFLSFAGNLTYPGAKALRDAYARVPLDRLLLETDAPYLNPMPHRGKPSSPLDIGRTYEYAAALRDESVDRLREAMARNVRQLFGAPVRR